jgi:2-(3-amino-3-carboxypropyl)histidine synthase
MEIKNYKYPNYFTWSPLDIKQPMINEIDHNSIVSYTQNFLDIIERTDKFIGFQIPEGLKPAIVELITNINRYRPDLILLILFEPCFGSCDIVETKYKFLDKIFHFGNSGMPYIKLNKTFFIEMRYEFSDFEIDTIVQQSKKIGSNIGLLCNIQFYNQLIEMNKVLSNAGINTYIGGGSRRIKYKGQILGCNYSSLTSIEKEVDGFILFTHGDFHLQMIPLLTTKKVLIVDVIEKKIFFLNLKKEIIINKRLQLLNKCKSANIFGIIVSSKEGQNRLEQANKLLNKLRKYKKNGSILYGDNIYSHYFNNFNVDAFINLACPRIALNNNSQFKKPIITYTEALHLLENNKYLFDSIL